MRYADLSIMSKNIIHQAGTFSDPLRVDLENMVIDCDTEKQFLIDTVDYIEIILQDTKEFLENANNDSKTTEKEFSESVSKLHTMILQAIQAVQ